MEWELEWQANICTNGNANQFPVRFTLDIDSSIKLPIRLTFDISIPNKLPVKLTLHICITIKLAIGIDCTFIYALNLTSAKS
jgi:hypothetical protein